MAKRQGKSTILLDKDVSIMTYASAVGPKESQGPLKQYFARRFDDEMLGEDSFEKAESRLQQVAVNEVFKKADL